MKIDAATQHRPMSGPTLVTRAVALVGSKRALGERLDCSRIMLWRLQNRPTEHPVSYPMQVMLEALIAEEEERLPFS